MSLARLIRSFVAAGVLLVLTLVPALPALAARPVGPALTQSPDYVYAPGWNMAGAPSGMTFPSAAAMDSWTSGGYVASSTRSTLSCQGYWLYLPAATLVMFQPTAPLDNPGHTVRCPLQPGWNLVGNLFYIEATIPSGAAAFRWNPVTDRYDALTRMAMGEAVWMYAAAAGSVVLTSG